MICMIEDEAVRSCTIKAQLRECQSTTIGCKPAKPVDSVGCLPLNKVITGSHVPFLQRGYKFCDRLQHADGGQVGEACFSNRH